MKNLDIEFLCPSCGALLRAKQSILDKKVKCPKCSVFVLVKIDKNSELIIPENLVLESKKLPDNFPLFDFEQNGNISENNQIDSFSNLHIQQTKSPSIRNNNSTASPVETFFGFLILIFAVGSPIFGFYMYDQYKTIEKESKIKNNDLVRKEELNNSKLAEIDKKLFQIRENTEKKAAKREMELETIRKEAAEKDMEIEAINKKAAKSEMELEAIRKEATEKEIQKKVVASKNSTQPFSFSGGGLGGNSKQDQYAQIVSSNQRRGVVTLSSLTEIRAICENPSQYVGLTAFLPFCLVKAENINRNSAVNGHIFSFSTGDITNLERFGNSLFIDRNSLNFGMSSKIADEFKARNYIRRRSIEIALSGIQDRLSVPIRETHKWQNATMNMRFSIIKIDNSESYIAHLLSLFVTE